MTKGPPAGTESEEPGQDFVLSPVEREAIRWVVRLTSGESGAAERRRFRAWVARSAGHRAALRGALRLWLGLGRGLPSQQRPGPPRDKSGPGR
jgi:transmembrane sensor